MVLLTALLISANRTATLTAVVRRLSADRFLPISDAPAPVAPARAWVMLARGDNLVAAAIVGVLVRRRGASKAVPLSHVMKSLPRLRSCHRGNLQEAAIRLLFSVGKPWVAAATDAQEGLATSG